MGEWRDTSVRPWSWSVKRPGIAPPPRVGPGPAGDLVTVCADRWVPPWAFEVL